ncbi:sigma factor-like helix-turn-helix DNA-binding protein [Pedobacter gandavensis]|uniref:sigma factor-like helix-turn-helix DNA-binding protein n=1 Tax=Pedobacter gandavensis TaxID=2679963 RepID=UPI003D7C2746
MLKIQLFGYKKAISHLPAQRQAVFRLCKLEEKSYEEVNKILGLFFEKIHH